MCVFTCIVLWKHNAFILILLTKRVSEDQQKGQVDSEHQGSPELSLHPDKPEFLL